MCLLIAQAGISQETEFKFGPEEFTKFTVIPCEGKTKEEIYKKVNEWINKTYDSPKDVIKGQVENDYIRFQGTTKTLLCPGGKCNDARYQIELSVKDGKYKFEVISIEQYLEGYGWQPAILGGTSGYYKNGKIKNMFKNYPTDIPKYFNTLNKSLEDFVMGRTKDDW